MSDIQRYRIDKETSIPVWNQRKGEWIKHKDHLKAISLKKHQLVESDKRLDNCIQVVLEKQKTIEELKAEVERLNLQIARLTTDDFIDSDFLNELDFKDLEICNLKSALDEALQNYWHEGDERWQYFKRLIEQPLPQPPNEDL